MERVGVGGQPCKGGREVGTRRVSKLGILPSQNSGARRLEGTSAQKVMTSVS